MQRLDQLLKKGKSSELIHRLAEDALEWAKFRSILQDQVNTAREFGVKYSGRYEKDNGLKDLQKTINNFEKNVNDRISKIDQTVRDLLQIVSIFTVLSNNSFKLIFFAGVCLGIHQ
jgi:hypothetical protein